MKNRMIVWRKRLFYKYIGTNSEFYIWYLINMILNPKSVYETSRYQFSLTQQWHRRDHSITKLIFLINIVIVLIYAFTFSSPFSFIPYILFNLGFSLFFGIIISTVLYYVVISVFKTGEVFTVRYSYDIHNNAYLCYLFINKVIIFILSPILLQKGMIFTILSNVILFFGYSYYFYVTYLGYAILPFIKVPQKALIIPITIMGIFVVFCTMCNYNIASLWI